MSKTVKITIIAHNVQSEDDTASATREVARKLEEGYTSGSDVDLYWNTETKNVYSSLYKRLAELEKWLEVNIKETDE